MHFEFCLLFPSLMRLKANLMENVRRCKYVQNFSEGHSLFHLKMIHYSGPAWHLAYIFFTVCGHLIFAILLIFCHFFFETFLLMMYGRLVMLIFFQERKNVEGWGSSSWGKFTQLLALKGALVAIADYYWSGNNPIFVYIWCF